MSEYRSLDPDKVIATIDALQRRISERFVGSGLSKVCAELCVITVENSARARRISAGNMPLRVTILIVFALGAVALGWIGLLVWGLPHSDENTLSLLQGLESTTNLAVLVGAATFFLVRIEEQLKRRQALAALHELRSIMHVIDMHQLSKDPGAMRLGPTPSSPERPLSRIETARYLDYCSEMLSLSAKVAVLFAQGFPDATIVESVSEIERLGTGLSQKIWQKIMIIQAEPAHAAGPDRPVPGGRPVV